jgi:hypothetical protein
MVAQARERLAARKAGWSVVHLARARAEHAGPLRFVHRIVAGQCAQAGRGASQWAGTDIAMMQPMFSKIVGSGMMAIDLRYLRFSAALAAAAIGAFVVTLWATQPRSPPASAGDARSDGEKLASYRISSTTERTSTASRGSTKATCRSTDGWPMRRATQRRSLFWSMSGVSSRPGSRPMASAPMSPGRSGLPSALRRTSSFRQALVAVRASSRSSSGLERTGNISVSLRPDVRRLGRALRARPNICRRAAKCWVSQKLDPTYRS